VHEVIGKARDKAATYNGGEREWQFKKARTGTFKSDWNIKE